MILFRLKLAFVFPKERNLMNDNVRFVKFDEGEDAIVLDLEHVIGVVGARVSHSCCCDVLVSGVGAVRVPRWAFQVIEIWERYLASKKETKIS